MRFSHIMVKKVVFLLLGVSLSGFGLGLTVVAGLGLSPWDVLHQALSTLIGWTIGQASILVSFVIMLCWIPLKQKPGFGTFLGIVVVGLLIDLTIAWLPTPPNLVIQWTYLLSGIGCFSIGISAFVSSQLGVGPRDGLMLGIAKKGYSLQKTRIVLDGSALTVGWLMGGTVGLGTVVIVLGVGPVVQHSMKFFTITEQNA